MELKMKFFVLVLAIASSLWSQVPDSAQTSVQWILLDANTGIPLPLIRLLIEGDTVRTDANGSLETRHARQTQVLSVRLLSDSLELSPATYNLDSTQEFAQFTLESQVRTHTTPSPGATPAIPADMVVVARRDPLHDRKEASKVERSREEMRQVAGTQNDPIQVLRTEPGVSNQNDLNQRPHVRGGDWYETRVFWNGAPVIQPFHATSMFSVFNMEATEDMTFYSGGFPVEGSNSLSGALFMRARPAPLDSFGLWVDMSWSKGHFWTGFPIVKDKFAVYFAYQAYWYDWVIKRGMEASTYLNDDPEYEKEVDEFVEYMDLPNFKDLQTGFSWAINPRMRLDYHYLRGMDIFRVVQPVRETLYDNSSGNTILERTTLDTIALVDVPNQIHGLNLRYTISDRWDVLYSNTYQLVDWNVRLGKSLEATSKPFDYSRQNIHSRLQNYYRLSDAHLLNFGASFEKDRTRYAVTMPRFAYELMMQSNMDMMENLGYYAEKGLSILMGDQEDDWEQLIENIMMDYQGTRTRYTAGTWIADEWKINPDNRLTLGTRIDWEDVSQDIFLSPRASWFHRINPQHELTFSAGLYHQDNFEFYYRHLNPDLASEKAVHLNAEWSYDITPDYRLELMNYGKYYFDLASAQLTPINLSRSQLQNGILSNGKWSSLDELRMAIRGPSLNYNDFSSNEMYNEWQNLYYSDLKESELRLLVSDAEYQEILERNGSSALSYTNQGIGVSLGSELRLNYDPTRIWRGWVSGEVSTSKRKDHEDGIWYDFRRYRPWAIKWHNYFKMPSEWELSIRYTYTGGMAYTGYDDRSTNEENAIGDTLFVVERKNNRNYSAYTRIDLRLEKNYTIFGHPAMSYFEVWNAFNSANFLLTDSETGKLRYMDANYPVPIFYSGLEWRW